MNLLAFTFLFLNVFTFIFGGFVNYLSTYLPESVVRMFRYGRANIHDGKSGFLRSIEVPKRWFWHFYTYAVLFQLAVLLAVISTYWRNSPAPNSWLDNLLSLTGHREQTVNATVTVIASFLFLCHLCRRLYETLCVCVYSDTKMNVFHYLLGYLHYTGTILCLVAHSPIFASSKKSNEDSIFDLQKLGAGEILGILLLLLGNYLQNRAHVGLANLRKGKDKEDDEIQSTGHKIPRGGLFEWISCPNYFAEILIYLALSSLHGFQNKSLNYCTFWVICNQVTAGIMNDQWYRKTFHNYPVQRKAIIPLIF